MEKVEGNRFVYVVERDARGRWIRLVRFKTASSIVLGKAAWQLSQERPHLCDVGRRIPVMRRGAFAAACHQVVVDVHGQTRQLVVQQLLRHNKVCEIPQDVVARTGWYRVELCFGKVGCKTEDKASRTLERRYRQHSIAHVMRQRKPTRYRLN